MKTLKPILLVFAILSNTIFATCTPDDDDGFSLEGNNISMTDIAGSWTATYARFSSTNENPPVMTNVVDEGGTVTLAIQSNGRFTFTISFAGESPEVSTGQLGFEEDYLIIAYDDDPEDYEYMGIQLNEDHDEMMISGPAEYDFDEDGDEEPALVVLELSRN